MRVTNWDNLKLGYGGTKTEMERLLRDAEKLSGVKYDISSYADIVEAIHVIQTNLGITGTTAQEAAETIEGSARSAKAAWQNLLVSFGSGKDVKKAMGNFSKSAKNVIKNVVPVVKNALVGIGEFVKEIGPVLIDELPGLVRDLLPGTLDAAGSLVKSLASALPGVLGAVWESIKSAVGSINWAEVGKNILDFISGAWADLTGWAATAWEGAKKGIQSVNWAEVGERVKTKIGTIWADLKAWASGIWESAKSGIESVSWGDIGETVKGAVSGAWAGLSEWANGLWTSAKAGIESVDWTGAGTRAMGWIKTAFLPAAEWLTERFREAAAGIEDVDWTGMGARIWTAIKNAFSGAVNWFYNLFKDSGETAESAVGWEALGESIADLIEAGLKGIGDMFFKLLSDAKDALNSEIDWHSLGEDIASAIDNGLQILAGLMLGEGEAGRDGIAGIDWWRLGWDIVVAILDGMAGLAQGMYDYAANGIKQMLGLEPDYRSAGQKAVDAILEDWDRLPMDARKNALKAAQAYLSPDDTDTWKKIGAVVGEELVAEFWTIPKEVASASAEARKALVGGRGGGGSGWYGAGRTAGGNVATGFADSLSAAGQAVSRLQEMINNLRGKRITIALDAVMGANADKLQKVTKNARAMNTGHIFRKPSIFGFAEGAFQMAGDAGPEAVVGVNSLDRMIQSSVNSAVGGIVSRLDKLVSGQNAGNVQIVLDSGALVGELVGDMDGALNDRAQWKGYGRA